MLKFLNIWYIMVIPNTMRELGIIMSEKNNFKKNKQQTNDWQEKKKVYEERINEYFSVVGESEECFCVVSNSGVNSSLESEDTYPIDIDSMTGKPKKEGEKK